MSTPPRSPCSWIQRTSSIASSTSFRKIWPMPARRFGKAAAPVGEPAVVRADAGQPVLVLVGLGRPREEDEAREERRHRVGEHDLGHDAVGLFVGEPALVVPVADAAAVFLLQIAERVLVLVAPRVEVVEVRGIEVLAVHLVAAAGVRVGGDDRVALVSLGRAHVGCFTRPECPLPGQSAARRLDSLQRFPLAPYTKGVRPTTPTVSTSTTSDGAKVLGCCSSTDRVRRSRRASC